MTPQEMKGGVTLVEVLSEPFVYHGENRLSSAQRNFPRTSSSSVWSPGVKERRRNGRPTRRCGDHHARAHEPLRSAQRGRLENPSVPSPRQECWAGALRASGSLVGTAGAWWGRWRPLAARGYRVVAWRQGPGAACLPACQRRGGAWHAALMGLEAWFFLGLKEGEGGQRANLPGVSGALALWPFLARWLAIWHARGQRAGFEGSASLEGHGRLVGRTWREAYLA